MSCTSDQIRVVMEALQGTRVDRRFMVACNVVGALRAAGLLAYPTDEPTEAKPT